MTSREVRRVAGRKLFRSPLVNAEGDPQHGFIGSEMIQRKCKLSHIFCASFLTKLNIIEFYEILILTTWLLLVSLFVNLTFENTIGFFIQWVPKLGESGWTYTWLGGVGSGLPLWDHSPLTYFQRWESTATKSKSIEYIAWGSKPRIVVFSTGNMRLLGKSVFINSIISIRKIYSITEYCDISPNFQQIKC